jgi:hypothetical protein
MELPEHQSPDSSVVREPHFSVHPFLATSGIPEYLTGRLFRLQYWSSRTRQESSCPGQECVTVSAFTGSWNKRTSSSCLLFRAESDGGERSQRVFLKVRYTSSHRNPPPSPGAGPSTDGSASRAAPSHGLTRARRQEPRCYPRPADADQAVRKSVGRKHGPHCSTQSRCT